MIYQIIENVLPEIVERRPEEDFKAKATATQLFPDYIRKFENKVWGLEPSSNFEGKQLGYSRCVVHIFFSGVMETCAFFLVLLRSQTAHKKIVVSCRARWNSSLKRLSPSLYFPMQAMLPHKCSESSSGLEDYSEQKLNCFQEVGSAG